jgi:hypothetical protein
MCDGIPETFALRPRRAIEMELAVSRNLASYGTGEQVNR